ncbi:glycosyltransferase [Sodalis sp. dw_96]|uniref:glycosyltransferase n=1 Tax=Sodalis sp. dw_96 TaxID=2719794 RepID=UPI001BD470F0|nr:glycosyltransferase [Sodalis sp. dw_96]
MTKKLVSVYIATHNRAKLLERAINSVINQDYQYIEILICDDGSTDDTVELAADYANKFGNIIYLRNEIAQGACSARNLGINNANGEFITGLDDDDEFCVDRISKFVTFFERNNYSFLSSGIIYDYGKHKKEGYTQKGEIKLDKLLYNNIVGSQVFTKTSTLRNIGGFDESFKAWQDYDTWIRLSLNYGVGFNIGNATYVQHLEHEYGRITTSNKLDIGYNQFLKKHKSLLNEKNKKSLYVNYKMAKGEALTLSELYKYMYLGNLVSLSKFQIKKYLYN